jgi:hypothetical protein
MASHRKMLIEVIIVDLSVVTVFASALNFHGLYGVPKPFGTSATGCTFLFEKASLSFPNCLCILVSDFPENVHIVWAIQC